MFLPARFFNQQGIVEQLVPEQTLVLLSRYFNDMSKMFLGPIQCFSATSPLLAAQGPIR